MQKTVLITNERIIGRVNEIAADIEIHHPHAHSEDGLLLIAILKGAAMFANDIQRALYVKGVDAEIEYVPISSYADGTQSSGKPVVETDLQLLEQRVKDRHVVVVEDIIETGHTLGMFLKLLEDMGVSSITTVVLLAKDVQRAREVEIDHVGFEIGDEWVDGYGVDTAQKGRGNPDIMKTIVAPTVASS